MSKTQIPPLFVRRLVWFLFVFALGLVSCEPKRYPSILLLAVDHFGPQAIDCTDLSRSEKSDRHDAQYRSGFQQLCTNFIRYSRAFSTSTQTVPALSSILTGAYPAETGVHDNYGDFLSPQFETLAKLAVKKKWSTFFSSGGSPVLRRTGLGIGFQVFDDAVKPSLELIHRPAPVNFDNYFRFLSEAPQASSFAVLYIPDLLYIKTKTQNSLGEERGLSFESQLENLDENLGKFFQKLKSDNRWDSTTIVLVGLNNMQLGSSLSSSSEVARVSLYIKPMEGYANLESLKASRDSVVSLPDLSATLYAALGSFRAPSELSLFKSYPLERVDAAISNSRWIPMESPGVNDRDHFLWSVGNSQVDCNGGEPIECFTSTHDVPGHLPLSKVEFKSIEAPVKELLSEMKKRIDAHDFHSSVGVVPMTAAYEKCMDLIKNHNSLPELVKDCSDSEVLDFLAWVQIDLDPSADYAKKENARRRFQKEYSYHELDKNIEKINAELGYIWPQRNSARVRLLAALMDAPQYSKYRNILIHNSSGQ